MTDHLHGVTAAQRRELQAILAKLAELWADLTRAAAANDQTRVAAIQRQIAECRERVETIKRAGTRGTA